MMAKRESDRPAISDLDSLAEEMEKAMVQARKAMADLPPLEELAELQEAMAGLAGMGTVIEKLQLAAQQRDELLAELIGEPDWRVQAEIEVKKDKSSLMKVELAADFDLERIVEAHDMLSSEEAQAQISATLKEVGVDVAGRQEQMARGRGVALARELKVLGCHIGGVAPRASEELRLTPEANIPLKVSDERELCFEFAPLLTIRAPVGDPDWEEAELPNFAPTIDEVRESLDSFQSGKPFQRSLTVSQEELSLELKLAFRPI